MLKGCRAKRQQPAWQHLGGQEVTPHATAHVTAQQGLRRSARECSGTATGTAHAPAHTTAGTATHSTAERDPGPATAAEALLYLWGG